jgi:hypothetical protein
MTPFGYFAPFGIIRLFVRPTERLLSKFGLSLSPNLFDIYVLSPLPWLVGPKLEVSNFSSSREKKFSIVSFKKNKM